MDRYLARQPIFNHNREVHGYELLYRGSSHAVSANVRDGDMATRSLLSDAITVFGLSKLTNKKTAFVNFTETLILTDFALLAHPNEITVEILEDTKLSAKLIHKLEGLKKKGYPLALDDYTGKPYFDPILPLMNVIKVDFMQTTPQDQQQIAQRLVPTGVRLLAEKVESLAEFERGKALGYTLFQGYFFEKPLLMNKKAPALAASSYIRLLKEVAHGDIDIDRCARIVHADATLTHQLFLKVRTLQYYRGNSIQGIMQALIILGTDEIRRWCLLLLARERNVTCSDELVREAYLRGIFSERLMGHSPWASRGSDGFLMGMFSLLDKIMGIELRQALKDLPFSKDVNRALLGQEKNIFSRFLEFVLIYELKNPALMLPSLELTIPQDKIADLYMQCIVEADSAFSN